jgi:hypothetical protein
VDETTSILASKDETKNIVSSMNDENVTFLSSVNADYSFICE